MNEKEPIKQSLDKFSQNLDQETLNQLDQVRKTALATSIESKWYQNISWAMLGPVLASLVLVFVLLISNDSHLNEPQTENFLDDLDLLANEVDADLLADLEFIVWLEQENFFEGELL